MDEEKKDYLLRGLRGKWNDFKSPSFDGYRNDDDIARTALDNGISNYKYIGEELKNNLEFAKEQIQWRAEVYKYLPAKLKNNDEIIGLTLSKKGEVLKHMSDRVKDDKEFVLKAVKNTGSAIEYASEKLRNDKDVASVAINQHPDWYKYCGEKIKEDKEILHNLLTKYQPSLAEEYPMRNTSEKFQKQFNNIGRADIIKTLEKEITDDKRKALYQDIQKKLKPNSDLKPTQQLKI